VEKSASHNILATHVLLNHSPSSSFEPVVVTTTRPHWLSGQVLSRHLIVSKLRCNPCHVFTHGNTVLDVTNFRGL